MNMYGFFFHSNSFVQRNQNSRKLFTRTMNMYGLFFHSNYFVQRNQNSRKLFTDNYLCTISLFYVNGIFAKFTNVQQKTGFIISMRK